MDDKHIYEFHSNLMHTMKKKKKGIYFDIKLDYDKITDREK